MVKATTLLSIVLLIGCGGSGDGSAGGGGGDNGDMAMPTCSGTLSGGLTGTFGDCDLIAGYSSGQASFEISVQAPPSSVTDLTMIWSFSGMLATGTYKDTDTGAKANLHTGSTADGATQWDATVGGSDPKQGSYTLTLSSVTPDGPLYDVHGSLSATLAPIPGGDSTGTVAVSMTF